MKFAFLSARPRTKCPPMPPRTFVSIFRPASNPWQKMYMTHGYAHGVPPGNPHFPHGYPQKLWVKGRVFRGFPNLSTAAAKMHKNYTQTSVCNGLIRFKCDQEMRRNENIGIKLWSYFKTSGRRKAFVYGNLWLSTALNVAQVFLNITKVFLLRGLNVGMHQRRPAATAQMALMSSAVSSA